MENQDRLKAELELLEIIDASTLEKEDFFLMHWQNQVIIIMSMRLRELIRKLYPAVIWIKDDQVGVDDWEMMEETLRGCIRK